MSNPTRAMQMRDVQNEAFLLFKKKNKDYGDAFADYGPVGVLVRLGDKLRRFASITKSGVTLVNDESLRDTLIDLHNYAAMAVILMDEGQASNVCFDGDEFTFMSAPSTQTEASSTRHDMLSRSCDAFEEMIQNGLD